jgi:hypothetical protein
MKLTASRNVLTAVRASSLKTAFALAALTITVAGGMTLGSWAVSGSGNAYAKASTATALTIGDASASTTAQLYPGGSGDVKVMITNPNAFGVTVTSVTRTGAIASDKGAACDASTGVTFTNQTNLTATVAAGATQTLTLTGAASMSNASDNSCQGAVFTIPVSVAATS